MEGSVVAQFIVRDKLLHIGGGRGVFAVGNGIRCGVCISAEMPFYLHNTSDENETVVKLTLHQKMARQLLLTLFVGGEMTETKRNQKKSLECLYPMCGGIEDKVRERAELQHGVVIDALVKEMGNVVPRALVISVLLAVQFNAFSSGLYLEQAMINHSCLPNAVKLCFADRPGSFVFATRDILDGEEITITYCGSLDRSFAYRRSMMSEQHYFEISTTPFGPEIDPTALPEDVEAKMLALEKLDPATSADAVKRLNDLVALVGDCHLSVAHAHGEAIRGLLSELELNSNVNVAIAALQSCMELERLYAMFMPPMHYDRANVAEDLETLIGFLLSKNRKLLFAAFPKQYPHYAAASKGAFEAAQRKQKIRNLYDFAED